jgi:hypothetical protein
MLRITKFNKIKYIKFFTKKEMPEGYKGSEIESFILIPGVTNYNHILTYGSILHFDSSDDYIAIEFESDGDLERFLVQLMRDIKLNQITNLSVDLDKK